MPDIKTTILSSAAVRGRFYAVESHLLVAVGFTLLLTEIYVNNSKMFNTTRGAPF